MGANTAFGAYVMGSRSVQNDSFVILYPSLQVHAVCSARGACVRACVCVREQLANANRRMYRGLGADEIDVTMDGLFIKLMNRLVPTTLLKS